MDKSIYQFSSKTLQGKEVAFSEFKGKVLLIVNTATDCGESPQFIGLEELYQKFKDQGLVVIGFPSGQFNQESREGDEIKEFCAINYGVTFPIMEKIQLKGKDAHPVFKFFADKKLNGKISSKPYWNFYKYLVGRDGNVIDYFFTYRYAKGRKITRAIETALAN